MQLDHGKDYSRPGGGFKAGSPSYEIQHKMFSWSLSRDSYSFVPHSSTIPKQRVLEKMKSKQIMGKYCVYISVKYISED